MSWLFSQALVEASSAATSSDGAPSAPSSGSPTQQAYLPPDRMTAFSRPFRSGMTFKPLTDDLGAAVLTWCLEVSRARTSAWPAKAQALTESAPACGDTWRGSLARFDPATSSWRTAQPSLLEDLGESSVIWPRSGMTANGQCWELPTLEPHTAGIGSGLWPTPTCPNGGRSVAHVTDWRSERTAYNAKGKKVQVDLGQAVKRWPTPTSTLGTNGGLVTPTKAREGGTLIEALSARTTWPTPTVCGNYNRKGASATSGDGLATAVTNWPTPTANCSTGAGHQGRAGGLNLQTAVAAVALKCATPTARDWRSGKASQATMERNSRPLSEQIGGSLNPTWVEWLMGWPLGWTDLEPLGTGRCLSVPQQPGDC